MKIANYIQDLLYRYECVIVPDFGAFLSQKQSAFIDEESESFYPPKKVVSFNRQLIKNDGLLANYIAEAENISYKASIEKIASFVQRLEYALRNEGQAELTNVGKFIFSHEETIQFEPANQINYLTDSFGLDSFSASQINREVYKKQVQQLEKKAPVSFTPERRKSAPILKYAAIGLLALGISGFTGMNIYSNKIAEHNVAEQQEAESKLQQQIQQATFIIDTPLPAVTFNIERQSGNYHVVAGAFRVEENAVKKVNELKANGHKARLIGANKYGLHQVVYASHQTRNEALKMLRKVKTNNKGAWLLVQDL